jgi:hypothetical protein
MFCYSLTHRADHVPITCRSPSTVAPEAGTPSSTTSTTSTTAGQIPLPDIRDTLRRKELQQKIAQMEADEETKKVRIKRSDKEAFAKVSIRD